MQEASVFVRQMSGADGGGGGVDTGWVCVRLGQRWELRGRREQAVAGKAGGCGITWPDKCRTLR